MSASLREGLSISGAAAVAAAGSIVAQLLFERALGVEGFAQWAFLNALLTIAIPVACLGSSHLILSEFFAGGLDHRAGLLALLGYLATWGFLGAVGFFAAYHIWAPGDAALPSAVGVALFVAVMAMTLVYPVFQARRQIVLVALWPLLQVGVRAAIALAAWQLAWKYVDAVLAWTVALLLLAVFAARGVVPALRRRLRTRTERPSRPGLWMAGIGFGSVELLDSLDLKLVVPLAAAWFEPGAVSAAALVVLLLSAAHFFPHVVVSRVLLPTIHRDAAADDIRGPAARACAWAAAAAGPVAVIAYFYADAVVSMLVAGDYADHRAAFAAVGYALVPLIVSQLATAPFLVRRHMPTLVQWRTESLVAMLVAAWTFNDTGVVSLIWAVAAGRAWLCVRALPQLRRDARLLEAPTAGGRPQ